MSTSTPDGTIVPRNPPQRAALAAPPLGQRPDFTPPTELLALARTRAHARSDARAA